MNVKDTLTFGGLKDATVLAGHNGLSMPLESVTVLEVAEESIATWTMKNQMFITSFYAIRDDIDMQKLVIRTLARCHCCALVICHIKYILQNIDPCLVELCNELDFPLIIANTDTSFVEIINPILNHLTDSSKPKEELTAIRSDFIDLLTSNRSIPEILKMLAYKVSREISFMDIHFNYLYSNKSDLKEKVEKKYFQEKLGWKNLDISKAHHHILKIANRKSMLYYVKKKNNLFGFLCIEYKAEDTTEQILAIADSLNLPCALLLGKTYKFSDVLHDYQQMFFSDLLVWNFRSKETAINRGSELGYDLSNKHCLICVNINDIQKAKAINREVIHYIQRWYYPNIEQIVKSSSNSNIIYLKSDIIIILLDNPLEISQLKKLTANILDLFLNSKKTSVSIGISNYFEQVADIPKAYQEAFDLAILGRDLYGVNKITTFQESGIFYYLKNAKPSLEIHQLCLSILEPLKAYDEAMGTELLATARTLFLNNMDVTCSADVLHIHRNTLSFRKKKIESIMGCHVFETPYSFNFMSALFIAEPSFESLSG